MTENFYDILGVAENASLDDIKKAYRNLSKQYHPDVNGGNKESEEKFKKINEAYSVIGDETKRNEYDQRRKFGNNNFQQFGGFGNMPPEFFDMFFNQGSSRYGFEKNIPKKGEDLKFILNFDLEDIIKTTVKKIRYYRSVRCSSCGGNGSLNGNSSAKCNVCNGFGSVKNISQTPFGRIEQINMCHNCQGSGTVVLQPCQTCFGGGLLNKEHEIEIKVPPGIYDGFRYKIENAGNESKDKLGKSGNLIVVCTVNPHPIYKVFEKDLHRDIFISFIDAIKGNDNFKVELLDKTVISISIPPNSENGKVLRLKNLGLPIADSKIKGNLFLYINIYIPKNISEESIVKINELKTELDPIEKNINYEDGILNKYLNMKHLYA